MRLKTLILFSLCHSKTCTNPKQFASTKPSISCHSLDLLQTKLDQIYYFSIVFILSNLFLPNLTRDRTLANFCLELGLIPLELLKVCHS